MPHPTEMNETLKIIKWARKQGALLIKVNGVELTFPPDIDSRKWEDIPPMMLPDPNAKSDTEAAKDFIRSSFVLDDPDYIGEQQERWMNSKPLTPQ